MGRFGGLGDARVGKALYFEPGNYIVKILKVLFKANRKGMDRFIVECEVLESDNSNRPVGCHPSQVIAMEQDAALGNIKAFLGCMLEIKDVDTYVPEDGQSVEEFWDEMAEQAVDGENPLGGTIARLRCVNKVTQAGNDFTLHLWEEVLEEYEAA